MKTSNITKSALALALGLCASGALAVSQPALREDFEGAAFNNGINGVSTNNLTWADTEGYSAVSGGKLVVDAADTPTSAEIASAAATSINDAIEAANRTASFTADVSFTPSKELVVPGDTGNNLKFALYAYDDGTTTNLYVYNGSQVNTGIVIPDTTARAVSVSFGMDNTARAFKVSYNGTTKPDTGWYFFKNDAAISTVEFAGNGTVDNIGFDYDLVDTPIQWPTTFTVASYVVDGVTNTLTGAGSQTISTEPGKAITFVGSTGYRTVTESVTAGTAIDLSSMSASGLSWYFPQTATAGQDGTAANPYEIDSVNALRALKAAITTVPAARDKNYKLTANIDATDLGYWDGIGVQGTAGSGLNGGTLDGSGYTISNLKFSAAKYRGFFNRMDDATIKNLTINVIDIQETNADEHGYAAFVGNMKNSKLVDCVATGTIGTTAKPAMHTCGGFAVKVDSAGVFVNCTNYIDIVCSLNDNPKIGGIVGLMQGGSLTNCWNYGDITATCKKVGNSANGAAGLVGYGQTNATTIYGGGNAGAVQSTGSTADGDDGKGNSYDVKVGTIIGMMASGTATITGGTVAQADAKSIGAIDKITGAKFATVSGDVATFVADSPLAAGNTYKVMASGVTATYAFTAAGTIAFDQSLATPTYAITAPGLKLTDNTADGVKTYTAAAYAVVNVTVTGGANATASWTVNDAASAQPTTITEGQSWAVTLTADSGYEFNSSNTTTLSGTAGAADFTIELPNATPVTVTVTVTGGANATAAWTVGESSAQPTTLTYGQAWSVTLTADTGYEFNGSNTTTLSGTAGTTDFTIALPDATAIPPAEYGTTEGKDTAIDIKSGEGSTSHTLTTTEATYLNELVTDKGGTAAAQADIEAAVAQLTEKEFTDAVLLNQDVTYTNAGSYEFKVSKISKNSSGVTVTVTLTRDGTPRGGIKGQLVLQTSETPNGTYADAAEQTISESSFGTDASPASAKFTFTGSYKFFKVVIR